SSVASTAILMVLVVMTMVEATPPISNRADALCTSMAARPNIDAATTWRRFRARHNGCRPRRLPQRRSAGSFRGRTLPPAHAAYRSSGDGRERCRDASGEDYRHREQHHRARPVGHRVGTGKDVASGHLSDKEPKQPEVRAGIDKSGDGGEHDWNRVRRLRRGGGCNLFDQQCTPFGSPPSLLS